jgi:hypothetical protein
MSEAEQFRQYALKKLYEHHAKDCVQAAELTVNPGWREQYLKLAREWTEAAAGLQAAMPAPQDFFLATTPSAE